MAFATTTTLFIKMVGTTQNSATVSLASCCIYDAENEIKKRLAKRYDFSAAPFISASTYPPMIVSLCETLAIGYFYENTARGSKESYLRSDKYIKRAMENIEQLQNGDAQLIDTTGVPVTEIEGDWTVYATEPYSKTFNEDDPESWTVSQDKLDDIADERD